MLSYKWNFCDRVFKNLDFCMTSFMNGPFKKRRNEWQWENMNYNERSESNVNRAASDAMKWQGRDTFAKKKTQSIGDHQDYMNA